MNARRTGTDERVAASGRFRPEAGFGYQPHLPVAERTAASAASPPAEMTGTSLADIDFHFDIPNPLSWQQYRAVRFSQIGPRHVFFRASNNY